MKIAYFDCPAGVAGDMWVAACVDAGAPWTDLAGAVASLDLGVTVGVERVSRGGLAGLRFVVHGEGAAAPVERRLAELLDLAARAAVPGTVAARAQSVFESLAAVEAAAHGLRVDEVHFHELGAVDTVVDVICGCFAMHLLGIERAYASAVEVGSGVVRCAHGLLPVPAPGTAGLLHGLRQTRRLAGECTTPTGAALLREFVDARPLRDAFVSSACGHGAGTRDQPGVPNLLRITVGELAGDAVAAAEPLRELACNLDTADGESLAWIVERALDQGALDAWVAPVTMKKGRPGHVLHVLTGEQRRPQLEGFLLEESSSLGIRRTTVERTVLERWVETVDGPFGPVAHKCARLPSGRVVRRPEDAELRRLVDSTGLGRRELLARLIDADAARREAPR